jgi:hypothetical protein
LDVLGTTKDVVIGIDSSTTAAKAIAWKQDGTMAGVGRSPIPLASPAHDRYEQNPEDWWSAACNALRDLSQQVAPERVAALAISNQRETFVPLGPKGDAVRPAIVWLDQRCSEEVAWLTARVGKEELHRITGKPPDLAPVAYRIAWMLRHEPALFRATAMFADCMATSSGGLPAHFARAGPAQTHWVFSTCRGKPGLPKCSKRWNCVRSNCRNWRRPGVFSASSASLLPPPPDSGRVHWWSRAAATDRLRAWA